VSTLALLGAEPAFPGGVPFVRPPAPPLARVTEILESSWDRGMLTNGPLVAELEARVAELLDVPFVVAVSSCTTGLMLALRALGVEGEVLMPSFTFSASAHAVAWNGATPRFAECDPSTFQLDLDDAARGGRGVSAVLATHVFGAPASPKEVEDLADRLGVPAVFDAAHALGARHAGEPVGRFGAAEVFSLTPTKPLVAGEGGLVATTVADVAEAVRIGRDYANPGDYDTRFVGLNGRMSELHAAVALASLESFGANQARRFEIVERYLEGLRAVPGIAVQAVPESDRSSWKDFTIAVDPEVFGTDRNGLQAVLQAEGVDTRRYFDPPVHAQQAYRRVRGVDLPVTDRVAGMVLSLPAYPALTDATVDGIVAVVAAAHRAAPALARTTQNLPEFGT
jgi:dTDP-4-amino-4,6-dideoxygalactose transaminase